MKLFLCLIQRQLYHDETKKHTNPSAELQELIALIDAHLAELDENGEIE